MVKYLPWLNFLAVIFILAACTSEDSDSPDNVNATTATVGKLIFEDHKLSGNDYLACKHCHAINTGFTDPLVSVANPVSEGAFIDRFGTRNAPTTAYTRFTPRFAQIIDPVRGPIFAGGLFRDGRRDTLETQAESPLFSPVEMANANKQAVVDKVKKGRYSDQFMAVFGSDVFNDTNTAFEKITLAIASYERSGEMNPFNSKFDCLLKDANQYPLSLQEQAGLEIFDGKGQCSTCHTLIPQPESGKVLLTNFQYFNTGVPANPDNPANKADANFVDLGLGGRLSNAEENGKFKTPTLRNVEKTSPYMHNGVFGTLEEVVAFYNIDEKKLASPPPEVIENIYTGTDFLGLNEPTDIDAVVAFMKALTDGTGIGICF